MEIEQLPQRKRKLPKSSDRRILFDSLLNKATDVSVNLLNQIEDDGEINHSNSIPTTTRELVSNETLQTIEDNITNRKNMSRATTTLESKDGCAGEFFECLNMCRLICTKVLKILHFTKI